LNFVLNLILSYAGTETECQAAKKAYRRKLVPLLETFQQHSVPKECSRHAALFMKYLKLVTEEKPHLQDTTAIYRGLKRAALQRLATEELVKLKQQT
jgi:hypothetical protein